MLNAIQKTSNNKMYYLQSLFVLLTHFVIRSFLNCIKHRPYLLCTQQPRWVHDLHECSSTTAVWATQ